VEQTADRDLLLLCVNLAQFRATAGTTGDSHPWRRAFEVKARQEIAKQRGTLRHSSHLVFVAWRSRKPVKSRFVQGKLVNYCSIDLQHCFAVNLQSTRQAQELFVGQNFYATRIMRVLAFRCLRMGSTPHNSWLDLVGNVPWLVWMDYYARRGASGISPDHCIQISQNTQ
jgi:hypothetical protein